LPAFYEGVAIAIKLSYSRKHLISWAIVSSNLNSNSLKANF